MNQPTREEFDALKEEVRQLREQHTEPMKVVLEQRPSEGETKLLETLLMQSGQQATAIGALQHDVSVLQRMVADDHMDVRKRLDAMAQDTQKRFDSIAQVQKLILSRLPEKGE